MLRIVAELVGERSDLRVGWDLVPTSLGRVNRFWWHEGTATVMDALLVAGASRDLDVPEQAKLLNAAADLSTVLVADPEQLHILTVGEHRRLPVPQADSATLLGGGRILVTAQRVDGGHRVHLIDGARGEIVDTVDLDVTDVGVTALPHPTDGTVLLDAGEGQNGSQVFAARADGDRLSVEPFLTNVVTADFSPSGDRLLLMPHPSFDSVVSLVDWPSRRIVRTLAIEELEVGEDSFDIYGCFVGADGVLVKTFESGLFLLADGLSEVVQVHLALDQNAEDDGETAETGTLIGLGPDTFAVDLSRGDGQNAGQTASQTATVWRLPTG
jgi:hypothetical protein